MQTSLKIPDGKVNIFAISFCSCVEQEKLESLERSCNKAPLCVPSIDHILAVSSVASPLNASETGGDLVWIQTCLILLFKLSCSYAN